jgi:hypothetical protein
VNLFNKIMAVVLIFFFFMMFLIIAPLAFTTIEPLYTIKNYDEHPHNTHIMQLSELLDIMESILKKQIISSIQDKL